MLQIVVGTSESNLIIGDHEEEVSTLLVLQRVVTVYRGVPVQGEEGGTTLGEYISLL